MKQIFKNLCKTLSLILIIAISTISFVACKNNDSDEEVSSPTTESISDTIDNNENDVVADEVTDEEEKTEEDTSTEPETDSNEESKLEETTSDYPVTSGLYNHNKETLTFSDIYYEVTESELLTYFKTRDLNGVYGAVKKLGFDEFVKSITTYTEGETSYKKVVCFHKNESDGSELGLSSYYVESQNSFIDLYANYVYSVEDGKIVDVENQPKIIVENGLISILYQFTYTDSETNETVYTPLYVKSNLTIFNEIDIMDDASLSGSYQYLDLSARIESADGFLNLDEANKKLEEMLKLEESELVIDKLQNFELYFNDSDALYILNTENNVLLTEKVDGNATYLLYDSCYLTIVNEYYDLTLGLNLLNIEIEIDENSKFVCTFYNVA